MTADSIDQPPFQGVLLVTDDDPMSLYLLSGTLESEGYKILRAQSGAMCLEIAENERPDLILLDVVMPGMGGMETCRQLKKSDQTENIPVIFLSAQDDPDTKAQGFEVGGVDYVQKPFDARELLARVAIHLKLREQERQIQLYADSLEAMINERTRRLSKAEDQLQRDNDIQRVLNAQLRISIEGAPLHELLRTSLEQVLGLSWLPLENCGAIYLVEEGHDVLRLAAYKCLPGQTKPLATIPMSQCPETFFTTNTNEISIAPVSPADVVRLTGTDPGEGENRVVCMPITHGAQNMGLFLGMVSKDREFDVKELSFFSALTNTLGRLVLYKRTEEQLRHNAYYDTLTGLPNRTLFHERLGREMDRYLQRNIPDESGDDDAQPQSSSEACPIDEETGYAVLLMDLDRFTTINESLGHAIGDTLIQELSKRLVTHLGKKLTVARLGGDEFAVLMPYAFRTRDTYALAQNLLDLLDEPFILEGQSFFMTSSIGVALAQPSYQLPEEVIRDADAALHRAKSLGRGRYEVFDRAMREKALKSLRTISDMRLALERDEFLLHYQPIVDLKTGRVNSFEALVRWQHPKNGLVPPGDFIPLAEETGIILPLGEWVLREACKEIGALCGKASDLKVAVNLSPKQFSQKGLFKLVEEVLGQGVCTPHMLKLEITESAVMEDVQVAVEKLRMLKNLDVRLSIDDFGTGYSSLAYLQRFPVDILKIDRSFVSRMDQSEDNLEIVRTVIVLAHNMGMEVVAEGIETLEQMRLLMSLGCEYGQGYYFSRPIPMEQVRSEDIVHKTWDIGS